MSDEQRRRSFRGGLRGVRRASFWFVLSTKPLYLNVFFVNLVEQSLVLLEPVCVFVEAVEGALELVLFPREDGGGGAEAGVFVSEKRTVLGALLELGSELGGGLFESCVGGEEGVGRDHLLFEGGDGGEIWGGIFDIIGKK